MEAEEGNRRGQVVEQVRKTPLLRGGAGAENRGGNGDRPPSRQGRAAAESPPGRPPWVSLGGGQTMQRATS